MTAEQTSGYESHGFPDTTQPRKQSESSPESTIPEETVFGSPFDRFRPLGGGADGDIFRRYYIRAAEEADFLTHWVETRTSVGIFARDGSGTLVFRISSASLTGFNDELNIGSLHQSARWTHVYDAEGASWLTQFRSVDVAALPKIFDLNGQPVQHGGGPDRYGSSGHVARRQLDAEMAGLRR